MFITSNGVSKSQFTVLIWFSFVTSLISKEDNS